MKALTSLQRFIAPSKSIFMWGTRNDYDRSLPLRVISTSVSAWWEIKPLFSSIAAIRRTIYKPQRHD